jgi:hypothetical protein
MESLINFFIEESEDRIVRLFAQLLLTSMILMLSFKFAELAGFGYDGSEINIANSVKFVYSGSILIPFASIAFTVVLIKYVPVIIANILNFFIYLFGNSCTTVKQQQKYLKFYNVIDENDFKKERMTELFFLYYNLIEDDILLPLIKDILALLTAFVLINHLYFPEFLHSYLWYKIILYSIYVYWLLSTSIWLHFNGVRDNLKEYLFTVAKQSIDPFYEELERIRDKEFVPTDLQENPGKEITPEE